jgi:N-acylneuraminate cytidylyltransferase
MGRTPVTGEIMSAGVLAIIPARGGSKRIPRKNIKMFLGNPIIRYSIDEAVRCGCFDEIMVSTDDREVAEASQKYGAQVPFVRSAKTSDDFATIAEVLWEVLSEYKARGKVFEHACCIYPTAPLITAERLRQGYQLLREYGAESVIPVVRFSYPIQRALKIENELLSMIWPENINARSQDLMPAYHDAGQFCWFSVESFIMNRQLFSQRTVPLVIPESEVQDIDTIEDWQIAELKYSILKGRAKS